MARVLAEVASQPEPGANTCGSCLRVTALARLWLTHGGWTSRATGTAAIRAFCTS
eukprot:CAMPEP_0204219296 /NCGR_PEP_ID=MMETSP0361-20130328/80190_1 /ASSEMBLY_ACC=CAM_ASM_000343 /TAXON_ID=268821 /ORGANISM="Scrippsiella Hangoei, Strain SHTV-5" /LENGTH=54 /DNA_ID=CAMNT_0051184553 /DNA_START=24 /DNA_END=184 /DNA_ORIENTATION=-